MKSIRKTDLTYPLFLRFLRLFAANLYRPSIRFSFLILAINYSLFTIHHSFGAQGAPNVLLIVSEDNGQEIGCYGEPYVKTPNLDKLASEGVLFKNAYVAQAGCSQSRAAFLTGLYPHQNGHIGLATWKFRMYDEGTPNMVRSLKEKGYRTGIVGKLHVNPASAFPFDFKEIPKSNFDRKEQDRYASEAEKFINAGDAPFFLSVNYPDAHRPFTTQVDGLPKNPLTGDDVEAIAHFGITNQELRQQTADYYNCIMRLDTLIGDLLKVLEDSGKADNTLVFYLGDHGVDMLRGKRTSYEGGTRIPLIARWPGRAQSGVISEELVSLVDLMPTVIEATEAKPVANLAGRSLMPLLEGESTQWRPYLFTEFHIHSAHNYYPQRTVQDERYKLIVNLMPGEINPGYQFTNNRFFDSLMDTIGAAPKNIRDAYYRMGRPPQYELYDLKTDPHEFDNLAESSKHSKILKRLSSQLQTWREETNDPMLNPENVRRLKAEVDACFVDGQPDKSKLELTYPDYFFKP